MHEVQKLSQIQPAEHILNKDQATVCNHVAKIPDDAYFINPEGSFSEYWDMLMILLLLFTSLVTPFEVAFLDSEVIDALWIINRLVDLNFFGDMILQFCIPLKVYTEDATVLWNVNRKDIAALYLRGWFLIDFVSIFPFWALGLLMGDGMKQLAIFRLMRVARLAKLLKVMKASGMVQKHQARVNVSFAAIKLTKFTVATIFICHWQACGIQLISRIENANENWLSKYTGDERNLYPAYQLYIYSVYWAVMTSTTIGYGDITPHTLAEMIFCMFCMGLGAGFYAFLVGGICNVLCNLDPIKLAFEQSVDNLNIFMTDNRLPPKFQMRLRKYFFDSQQLMRDRAQRATVQLLSPMLRNEVVQYTGVKWMQKIPIFSKCPPAEKTAILTAMALQMQSNAFADGDHLVKKGDEINTMHLIQKGICLKEKNKRTQSLMRGNMVGSEIIASSPGRLSDYAVTCMTQFVLVHSIGRIQMQTILCDPLFKDSKKVLRRHVLKAQFRTEIKRYAKIYHFLFDSHVAGEYSATRHSRVMQALKSAPQNFAKETSTKNSREHQSRGERTNSSKLKGRARMPGYERNIDIQAECSGSELKCHGELERHISELSEQIANQKHVLKDIQKQLLKLSQPSPNGNEKKLQPLL